MNQILINLVLLASPTLRSLGLSVQLHALQDSLQNLCERFSYGSPNASKYGEISRAAPLKLSELHLGSWFLPVSRTANSHLAYYLSDLTDLSILKVLQIDNWEQKPGRVIRVGHIEHDFDADQFSDAKSLQKFIVERLTPAAMNLIEKLQRIGQLNEIQVWNYFETLKHVQIDYSNDSTGDMCYSMPPEHSTNQWRKVCV